MTPKPEMSGKELVVFLAACPKPVRHARFIEAVRWMRRDLVDSFTGSMGFLIA